MDVGARLAEALEAHVVRGDVKLAHRHEPHLDDQQVVNLLVPHPDVVDFRCLEQIHPPCSVRLLTKKLGLHTRMASLSEFAIQRWMWSWRRMEAHIGGKWGHMGGKVS